MDVFPAEVRGDDGGDDDEKSRRLAAEQLAHLYAVPFCVNALIEIGLPQIWANAEADGIRKLLTAAEIAKLIPTRTKGGAADPVNLERILRVLASHNLATEIAAASPEEGGVPERRYSLSWLFKDAKPHASSDSSSSSSSNGECLPLLWLHSDTVLMPVLHNLHEAVLEKTVEPCFLTHGKKLFDFVESDSRFGLKFSSAMASTCRMYVSLLLETYTGFEGLRTLVDVGGGLGEALNLILAKYPQLRGINFDMPRVVATAPKIPRLEHVGGDFFESVPQGDAVFMKWILHDWSDEDCLIILRNIEKALPANGKVIVMTAVLPETSDSSVATRINLCTDVLMMAFTSRGKERTLAEFILIYLYHSNLEFYKT